ncbi:glutamine amidotransferase [Mycobacterium kansasii ATCC 12478]|uniref:Glutamine amidotransferase n=1 Tax=Mycobacterium kansasii ATCC 12478 TaxID=557599 RepID=U5WZ15_MYCKA|nr:glutamine amidotransferase [Mycobacterium kansasii ATCC 12478]
MPAAGDTAGRRVSVVHHNARVKLVVFMAAVIDWGVSVVSNSSRGRRPVIGLTTYREQVQTGIWDVPASYLPADYSDAIVMAGGNAVLLPPQPADPDNADRVLDGLHALVITGGYDIDPAAYGQHPHPATDRPRADRDAWEFVLLKGALARELPVFGICRGVQLLNVALGGTLHQHLPDVIGHGGHCAGNAVFTPLPVRTVPGTRLAGLIGESADVPCYHHQAVGEVAAGLVVSATDADGVVEALELPGNGFVLAVQWHPEKSLDDLRLFAGLVAAARAYADGSCRCS